MTASVNRRWKGFRRAVRAKLARFTPTIVTSYPFEVFVTALGLIIGVPLVLGLAAPTSLVVLLPTFMYWAYAVAVILGACTVGVGLRTKHALVLAAGLQLLGGSFMVYALAVVAVAGWPSGFLAFAAFASLGLVCLIRSAHFRRLIDIQIGARQLEDK